MNQTGASADRPEAVRSARVNGSDSPAGGLEEQLGMSDILALLDTLHGAHGEAADLPAEAQGEAVAGQAQMSPWGQLAPLPNGAGIDRLVQGSPPAASLLATGQSPQNTAGPAPAALPLEQIEQWLAELQDLRSRHGQGDEADTVPVMGLSADVAAMPELQRLNWQVADMPPQTTHWNNAAEARMAGSHMAGPNLAGPHLAEPRAGEQTIAGLRMTNGMIETSVQASLMEEPALQSTTLRAVETLTAASTNAPALQAVSPATVAAEVRLHGSEARWGEQMLQALRDQIEMQIAQRSQHATIRLDPPDLGSLDIQINHEQGKLSVQINAGQADVARLLNMLSERLRHELLEQNFSEVKVQVGSHTEQGRQGRQRQDGGALSESITAAREIEQGPSGTGRGADSDVLISV